MKKVVFSLAIVGGLSVGSTCFGSVDFRNLSQDAETYTKQIGVSPLSNVANADSSADEVKSKKQFDGRKVAVYTAAAVGTAAGTFTAAYFFVPGVRKFVNSKAKSVAKKTSAAWKGVKSCLGFNKAGAKTSKAAGKGQPGVWSSVCTYTKNGVIAAYDWGMDAWDNASLARRSAVIGSTVAIVAAFVGQFWLPENFRPLSISKKGFGLLIGKPVSWGLNLSKKGFSVCVVKPVAWGWNLSKEGFGKFAGLFKASAGSASGNPSPAPVN